MSPPNATLGLQQLPTQANGSSSRVLVGYRRTSPSRGRAAIATSSRASASWSLPALAIERTDLALPAEDIEAAAVCARNEKAPATRAAYRSDFAMFRE
jgi:hypothetical protein